MRVIDSNVVSICDGAADKISHLEGDPFFWIIVIITAALSNQQHPRDNDPPKFTPPPLAGSVPANSDHTADRDLMDSNSNLESQQTPRPPSHHSPLFGPLAFQELVEHANIECFRTRNTEDDYTSLLLSVMLFGVDCTKEQARKRIKSLHVARECTGRRRVYPGMQIAKSLSLEPSVQESRLGDWMLPDDVHGAATDSSSTAMIKLLSYLRSMCNLGDDSHVDGVGD
jgi:hypothetical protein